MKKALLLHLFLMLGISTWSQNTIGLPEVINFNNTIYNGGTQNWDIKQDEEGRMYFANNEGLLIYDGSYWKIYPQPHRTILRSIALDNNRIYAGGQDEIGYYAPDSKGILKYVSLKNLLPKQYSTFTDLWDIEVYKQSVFFRTWDRIFEYRDDAIRVYPAVNGWEILRKIGDKLIAQDRKRGLMEFVNNEWRPLGDISSAPPFVLSGIVGLDDGSLLLSSLQNGLYIFHKGKLTKKFTAADDHFSNSHIYCMAQINSTQYVIGTTSQGCTIINTKGEVVQQIARSEGLQNNNVLSVFLDNDNNLWAGLDNGISFIAYNAAIKYIKPRKSDELSGYSVRVFDNKLYIATSDGAYFAPLSSDTGDFSFSKGDFTQLKNSSGQAWRFDEVNQQLLLGHHNGSFVIRKNEAVQLTQGSGAWIFLPTSPVSPARSLLIGTYGGLVAIDYEDNKFINRGALNGLSESLRFLTIDNNNVIWGSHPYRGIYRITLAPDGKSFNYELLTEKDGLPSAFRNYAFSVKNRVVFATERGIYEFDAQKRRFIRSPALFDIFGSTTIQYLKEDADGNIWFCSGKKIGVVSFTKKDRPPLITYFPELTGKILAGFEYVYPYDKENIFIASNTGIIHLNYKKYIKGNPNPGILLAQVMMSGKSDRLIFGGYIPQGIDSSALLFNEGPLHFSNHDNSFHFEFSSPEFGLQRNIEYSYQLKGYDPEWSAPTSKTEKEYTNLPEGQYTFVVKAYDNLGNASKNASYSFIIEPAWYQTIWAYFLYAAVLAALIFGLYKWQKRKFNLQRLQFQKEQARLKYIHQLEMEKNEKEIIQLQNDKLINEMIYKNKELADVSMHLVERSDALIKIRDELHRLHKKTGGDHDIQRVLQLINESEKNNSNWEQFAAHFDEINNDFIKNLKARFPNLTSTDLKVCTYLHLKLASKEIAQLMNISVRGVEISRYRLRKKLNLATGQTLNDFLNEIHIQQDQ